MTIIYGTIKTRQKNCNNLGTNFRLDNIFFRQALVELTLFYFYIFSNLYGAISDRNYFHSIEEQILLQISNIIIKF